MEVYILITNNNKVECLEQFFEANGIIGDENKAKRRSAFLSVVGPGPYKLL